MRAPQNFDQEDPLMTAIPTGCDKNNKEILFDSNRAVLK